MNRFRKIFFLITLVIFFVGIISPLFVFAAEPPKTVVNFCPQINIPGIKMFDTKTYKCEGKKNPITGAIPDAFHINTSSIAELAAGAYKFIAGIAGIAAVVVMMAGGYVWLFAGGNASKVTEAKSLITSAVLGLFLVLGSYMILNLINPELIKLKSLDNIAGITKIEMATASKICTEPQRNEFAEKNKINTVEQPTCGQVYIKEGAENCINISCPYSSDSICLLMIDSNGEYSGKGCVNSVTAAYGETSSSAGLVETFKVKGFSLRSMAIGNCGITTLNDPNYGDVLGGFCAPVSDYKDNTCYLVGPDNKSEEGPVAIRDGSAFKMHSRTSIKKVGQILKDELTLMGCRK